MPIGDKKGGFIRPGYDPLLVPNAPTIGTLSDDKNITFTAPSNVGGGAISSYTVIATDSSSGANILAVGTSSPINIANLVIGNTYTAVVIANNAYGPSPASSASNSASPVAPPGQTAYTTSGSYSFVVPEGVTSISAVAVGGGGAGRGLNAVGTADGGAGAGGALAYVNDIATTPGETLTIQVGAGGAGGSGPSGGGGSGGNSYIVQSGTTRVHAGGGQGGQAGSDSTGGAVLVGTGGAGGNGKGGTGTGGAGAGGYSGAGATNTTNFGNGVAGTGGSGGSGGSSSTYNDGSNQYRRGGSGGGGVGIFGQGSNGTAGTGQSGTGNPSTGGGGGSGGTAGGNVSNSQNGGAGGLYGGGSGGAGFVFSNTTFTITSWGTNPNGGGGAVRIIWGDGRAFPSTNTGDV